MTTLIDIFAGGAGASVVTYFFAIPLALHMTIFKKKSAWTFLVEIVKLSIVVTCQKISSAMRSRIFPIFLEFLFFKGMHIAKYHFYTKKFTLLKSISQYRNNLKFEILHECAWWKGICFHKVSQLIKMQAFKSVLSFLIMIIWL